MSFAPFDARIDARLEGPLDEVGLAALVGLVVGVDQHGLVVAVSEPLLQRAERDDTAEAFHSLESVTGHDLSSEDGRFGARDLIAAVLRPWFEAGTLDAVRAAFEGTGVSWGPYQTFRQLVEEDPRASEENPMFSTLDQPGIGPYLVPASPLEFTGTGRLPARRAPLLGDTGDPR